MNSIAEESAWLRSCQIPYGQPGAGALCMTPAHERCVPYFAALALTAALGAPGMVPCMQAYLEWHVTHLWPDGSIDDWYFDGEKAYSRGWRDSVDSYAATFLSLVRAYSAAAGPDWARAHLPTLRRVAGAIERVRSGDGLTWSRLTWPVKFTMDNCEVYRGLHDWGELLADLGEEEAAAGAREAAALTHRAVMQRLYDQRRRCFYYARLPLGIHVGPNWRRWLEATAQQFPLLFGLVPGDDRLGQALYERLCLAFPRWEQGETGDPFPWLIIGRAAAALGDRVRVDGLLRHAEADHIAAGRRYWYCGESGQYLGLRHWLAG